MHARETLAVVPLKALSSVKSRLSEVLDDESRQDLMAFLFDGVMEACAMSEHVGQTVVVAGDPVGVVLADPRRNLTLLEREPGLNGALQLADEQLARMGAVSSLVVVADLPLVTAADLDQVCAAAPAGPCVVVARTEDGGTSALFRRPATVIAPAFGPGSAAAHLAAAQAAGVPVVELTLPNLAMDLDTPAQLHALMAAGLLVPVPPS